MKNILKGILLIFAIIVGGCIIFKNCETFINRNNAHKVKVGMTKEQVKNIMGEPDEEGTSSGNYPSPLYKYSSFPPVPFDEPVIIFFKDSTFIVEQVRTGE